MMRRLIVFLLPVCFLLACESNETKGSRFFLKGNEELTKMNYGEAIRFYTEAIDKYPELEEAYNNRGVAYYKSGDYFNAIQDYTKVIVELNPENFDVRANRVDAYLALGRNDDALKDLEWAKTYHADSAAIDFKMGLAYFGKKAYMESVNSFNRAYEKDPTDVEALVNAANGLYFNDQFEEANKKLDAAQALDPSESNIYNTRCMMAIADRQYKEALTHITEALAIQPSNGIYLNNRGFLKLMIGDLEAGGKDIDRAIVADPQNAWAYRNKGIYYYKKARYTDAVRNFTQAAKTEEDMDFLYYYWGATLLELGNKAEACEKLKLSIDRSEPEGKALFTQNCGAN